MDYTLSDSFTTDVASGLRMHDDAKAIPTVWSQKDANSVIWSLMEIVEAAGLVGVQFDPAVPASYQRLLASFSRAGVFQTANQFDTTTKAATMAALQRALGSYSDALILNTNVALTNLDAGKAISFNSGATGCLLPLGSTLTKGVCFSLLSTVNGVAIGVQGGNSINMGTAVVGGLLLNAGDTLIVQWNGSSYACIGGSVQLGYSTTFGSNYGSNGLQKIPGGGLDQFLTLTTSASADVIATFPTAFVSPPTSVIGNCYQSGGSPPAFVSFGLPTATGIPVSAYSASTGARLSMAVFIRALGK